MKEKLYADVPRLGGRDAERILAAMYGEDAPAQRARYEALLAEARARGIAPSHAVSAPGRTELGGNHTDHNDGRVLAASIRADALVFAQACGGMTWELHDVGRGEVLKRSFDTLDPIPSERGKTEALIRGMASGFAKAGLPVGGFKAVLSSEVPIGSGLSSSASFEVAIGGVLSALFAGCRALPIDIAKMGRAAENAFFGKASGLMDQASSALGGAIAIDFAKPEKPEVEAVPAPFTEWGFELVIVHAGGNHANLSAEYSAIPEEMRRVASLLGANSLRGTKAADLIENAKRIRAECGDRAFLRALHFHEENKRVRRMAKALRKNNPSRYLELVRESGLSSWRFLQNVQLAGDDQRDQSLALALALSERLLGRYGVSRVHGGGFAGTMQAYVPFPLLAAYKEGMEEALGNGAVRVAKTRPVGLTVFKLT